MSYETAKEKHMTLPHQPYLLLISIFLLSFNGCHFVFSKEPPLWDVVTGPVYQDVAQHHWGDCWLDAAMASMAYANSGLFVSGNA